MAAEWMVAASGAGAILIIVAMNKMNRAIGYGWKFGSGYALIGVSVGGLGLLPTGVSVLPVLVLGFVLGMATACSWLHSTIVCKKKHLRI